MRKIISLILVLVFILVGCSNNQSFDSFFEEKMIDMEGEGNYSLIHKVENENDEKEKRFWYAISDQQEVGVKYIYNDGTEKIIEDINIDGE